MYEKELRNEHKKLTRGWTLLFARHNIAVICRLFQTGRRAFRWR